MIIRKTFGLFGIFVLIILMGSVLAKDDVACGNGVIEEIEECDDRNLENGDGCSSICEISLTEEVYIVSYVGDIDGDVAEDWYSFYKILVDFYIDNEITGDFSFYPGTITNDPLFSGPFLKMYESPYIELIQKGSQQQMDILSLEEQRTVIEEDQEKYKQIMRELLDVDFLEMPIIINQINGRFTIDTLLASEALGFKMYLDMFLEEDLGPVDSTDTYDVIQYGVSFSSDGREGRGTIFNSTAEIITQINEFDVNQGLLEIDEVPVIPIWAHQQDFESTLENNTLNEEKWEIYTETILRLKNDPLAIFITGAEIYALRHNVSVDQIRNVVELPPKEVIIEEKLSDDSGTKKKKKRSSGGGHSSSSIHYLGDIDSRDYIIEEKEPDFEKIALNDEIRLNTLTKNEQVGDQKGHLLLIGLAGFAVLMVVVLLFFLTLNEKDVYGFTKKK